MFFKKKKESLNVPDWAANETTLKSTLPTLLRNETK